MKLDYQIPPPEVFLLETPIYRIFDLEQHNSDRLEAILGFRGVLDTYCPQCSKQSTFSRYEDENATNDLIRRAFLSPRASETAKWQQEFIFVISYQCTRDSKHKMHFFGQVVQKQLQKTGQFPSLASLEPSLEKYRTVLSKQAYGEFNRAIGLASHGVGIGAFVYLRRIFEDLVELFHETAKAEIPTWNESTYANLRMSERIEVLQDYLPKFIVDNRTIYSVVSMGIHELSETECLEIFPAIKSSIEIILDQIVEMRERANKTKSISGIVSKIASKLKGREN